jgi:hypothetical protein
MQHSALIMYLNILMKIADFGMMELCLWSYVMFVDIFEFSFSKLSLVFISCKQNIGEGTN